MNEVPHFVDAMLGVAQMLDDVEKAAGYDQDTLQLEITTAEPHYIVFDRYLFKNVFVGDLEGFMIWANSQRQ